MGAELDNGDISPVEEEMPVIWAPAYRPPVIRKGDPFAVEGSKVETTSEVIYSATAEGERMQTTETHTRAGSGLVALALLAGGLIVAAIAGAAEKR